MQQIAKSEPSILEDIADKSPEKEYFDKNINVGYSDPDLPVPTNSQVLKHYFNSLTVYGIGLIIIWFNGWYNSLLTSSLFNVTSKEFFLWLYVTYAVVSPIIYFIFRPKTLWNSGSTVIFNYFARIINLFFARIPVEYELLKPTYREKQAILLFLIKIFFGPQMVQYSFANVGQINKLFHEATSLYNSFAHTNMSAINDLRIRILENHYFIALNSLFLIDVAIFGFGYLTESMILNNKVRYVESSLFGILVCIICYPPFNSATGTILGWYPNDNAAFYGDHGSIWTWLLRFIAISFLVIYTSASVALFTKASNLTNRGIVTRWPYSMVRHPAYLSKNMFWILTAIPIFFVNFSDPNFSWENYLAISVSALLSLSIWVFIYYLRAITEEKLLMKDPDYQAYMKKVPYRFIQGLW